MRPAHEVALALLLAAAGCDGARDGAQAAVAGGDAAFSGDSAVVLAAGDVAMCSSGARETLDILDATAGAILVVGDAAYSSERHPNPYVDCYEPTWGRYKARTHPVPGNHDFENLDQYFDYFGAAAGPRPAGYYSFDVGAWHVLALNSNVDMGAESEQGAWARRDLAASRARCTLAFMHHPRFSSGPHSLNTLVVPMWELLDSAGVDVVISGHDHIYERFAPMRANGARDDRAGVRQFIAGTGGAERYRIRRIARNSERRSDHSFGLLKLTLHPEAYRWEFVPAARSRFRDSGSGNCH